MADCATYIYVVRQLRVNLTSASGVGCSGNKWGDMCHCLHHRLFLDWYLTMHLYLYSDLRLIRTWHRAVWMKIGDIRGGLASSIFRARKRTLGTADILLLNGIQLHYSSDILEYSPVFLFSSRVWLLLVWFSSRSPEFIPRRVIWYLSQSEWHLSRISI